MGQLEDFKKIVEEYERWEHIELLKRKKDKSMSPYRPMSPYEVVSTGASFAATTFTQPGPKIQLQVGDKVIIIPGTEFYFQAPGEIGVVLDGYAHSTTDGRDWCRVQFPNTVNVYPIRELQVQQTVNNQTTTLVKKKKKQKPKVSFDSVIVSEEKKEQILSAISQQEHADKIFEKWGFNEVLEKGKAVSLLFWGGPGTGKTLMAEAIACKFELPLLMMSAAEIESKYPGEAERNIKRAFRIAAGKEGKPGEKKDENNKPVLLPAEKHLLLFDECDSLITNRKNVGIILASQINTMLSELERHEGIVVFTTNRLGSLDPAMERRLTSKIEFEFPNKKLRLRIWERMIPKKAPLGKDVDLSALAELPLAGGNIKNAVLNAARKAAYEKKKVIDMECFTWAVSKEVDGIEAFKKTENYSGKVASNSEAIRSEISGGDIERTSGEEVDEQITA